MESVKRNDQILADYYLLQKGQEILLKKMFYHLMDLSLWNSFVLYIKSVGTKSHLYFQILIVKEITKKYEPAIISPRFVPATTKVSEQHFPEILPVTAKQFNLTKLCHVLENMGCKWKENSLRIEIQLPVL